MIALNRHAIAFARGAVQDYGINPASFRPGRQGERRRLGHRRRAEPQLCRPPDGPGRAERTAGRARHVRPDRQPPLCLRPLHPRHGDAATRRLCPRLWRGAARRRRGGLGKYPGYRHRGRRPRAGPSPPRAGGHRRQGDPRQQRPSGKLRLCGKPADACLPLCLDDRGPAGRDAEETGRRAPLGGHPLGPDGHHHAPDRRPRWAATASSPAPAPASCQGWRPRRPR
jgi:hypothetical protein